MRVADTTGPLTDRELETLFAPFLDVSLIALAVSGGADSLALLDSVARWRRGHRSRPDALVLTVDHRLRRGAGREAAAVAAIAGERGMTARVLVWEGPRPRVNLEAAARRARYRLLLDAATEAGASHLLLAHHREDQAETFVMRLERGAGVFGLAAMRPSIEAGGVIIARPFLDVPRSRLAVTTAAACLEPVDDPMNSDPRFARARVRRMMPKLAAAGLEPDLFAAAARRLADAAAAIDAAAGALIAAAVETDRCGAVLVDAQRFASAADEVRMRVLVRLLGAAGGEEYPPRRERLQNLATAMTTRRGGRFKRTLAGTVVEWRAGRFILYREIGRGGLATVPLKAGFDGTWDGRFRVTVGRGALAGLTLGPLGEAGRRHIGERAGTLPAAALAAVPAIRRRGRTVAVPSLGYTAPGSGALPVVVRPVVGERLSTPPLFPDFTGAS